MYFSLHPVDRDFPDGLWPPSAVGLSGDPITNREINKHSLWSVEGVCGRVAVLAGVA